MTTPQQQSPDDLKKLVSNGLHKTRLNLLDLSGKNRLLNFKHTGSRILRFVDKLPNQILSELLINADSELKSGITLSSVPLPKNTDYPEIEDPKELKNIDVKAHAKKLGISTEWEMQANAESNEKKHQDNKLQTLLYPEDLDHLVRRIQSDAKTAIEESGVNLLFLCVGFLKWSDAKSSDIFFYAPLIMIPIEIERDKKINARTRTGFANFCIKYTGEDILDNICLREKLKQFAIELPSFEEFETPEEYFAALTDILKDIKPEWEIQRYITAGFLSFGRMLMYLDLDPASWPEIHGISDSPHIINIFRGRHSGDGSVAHEFDIDSDATLPKVPHVMDADSSQHSAIIDVLNGKNVVIEGPPGTGKSQTITNLIAACLAEGKTVLFVAEKLAALQVVRKRLDSVELGNFCLELHSHKTQKKIMMADLRKRLEMNTDSYKNAAATIEERLKELNKNKQELIDYTRAINSPFGEIKETPHQIFWKTNVLQKDLSQEYKSENFIAPKNVMDINYPRLRAQSHEIKILADNLQDYFTNGYITKDHFWHGINLPESVEYGVQQDIFRELQKLGKAALQAKEVLPKLKEYGFEEDVFANFRKLSSDLEIFVEDEFINLHLLDTFNSEDIVYALKTASDRLQNYTNQLDDYSKLLNSYGIEKHQVEAFCDRISVDEIQPPIDLTFQKMQTNLETINHAVINFEKTQSLFIEGASYINLENEKMSLEILRAVTRAAEICEKIDKTVLPYRNAFIENAIGSPALNKLMDNIVHLRLQQTDLDQYFDISNLPSLERLKEIQVALAEKWLFSILSSNWRGALESFRSFSRNKKEKDYKLASSKIDELIQHQILIEELAKNSDYNSLLPDLFQGINTNLDNLRNIVSFYETLRENTLNFPTYGTRIYTALKNQDRLIFDWFSQNKDIVCDVLEALEAVNSMLFAKGENSAFSFDVSVVLDKIKKTVSEFGRIKELVDDIKLPLTITLGQLKEIVKLNISLKSAIGEFKNDLVTQKLNLDLEEDALEANAKLLNQLHTISIKAAKSLPTATLPHVLCGEGFNELQSIKERIDCICRYLDALKSLHSNFPALLNLKDFCHMQKFNDEVMLESIAIKLDKIDSRASSFDKWCDIINSFARVKEVGAEETISSFVKAIDPHVPFLDYVPLYNYLTYNTLSNEALRQNKVLGSFGRIRHENIRDSFKEIDIELQKMNSQMLAHEISRRNIPEGLGGRAPMDFTDAHLIRHEIGKQKAHITIRKLVAGAYDALIAMKPCFMMGPLSVAQYLAPGHKKFDILIIDEASQIKPEDAIGVLARAKQVVIVGDSNQLPPMGFFDTLGNEGDGDDSTTIEDSESILEVCKPLFQPIRRLRWHYRSQHQSLISFSNRHFYDNDLIIFPSPIAHSDSMGVKHVYVADGIYSDGSNIIEARHLVQDIIRMVEQYPKRSYGIVTLNAKQKMLIENEIENARKENSVFNQYLSQTEKTHEDLFVKNLENVQGDERDIIYISTTFGPDENGVFRQNFGPINGKNGWRRLNVLFTRAKQHVRIFSSFYGDRIKVDDTKEQRGLRALKDYLQFAATGVDNHSYLTAKEPDSDFERAVGAFLRSKGYEIVYQLGVAGYLIDIVVRHPQRNSNYIIAIECDGATYHSAKSARDRDRLREENLRKLGWNHIHRIWSTDWFKRREQEEERLIKAVEIAIEEHNDRFAKEDNVFSLTQDSA